MKRAITFFILSLLAVSVFSQGWRSGRYKTTPPEYLVILNADTKLMMGPNSELNPWGYGFTAGYQYMTGKKKGYITSSHGFGGYLGLIHFVNSKTDVLPVGSPHNLTFYEYNNFNYVPIMLSYNYYMIRNKSIYFVGADLGVQMMIKERDYKDEIISYYDGENKINITRFLPSAKAYIGYMYQISTDFRLRAQVGADYIMGYTFDAKIPFTYRDEEGNYLEGQLVGKKKTQGLLNISASIGVVYSL